MKKVLFGLMALVGVSSFALPAQPQAAYFYNGVYTCPAGWSLVTTTQTVTYNVVVGNKLVCGPFGHFCVNQPVYAPVTTFVPANYCVPGVIAY